MNQLLAILLFVCATCDAMNVKFCTEGDAAIVIKQWTSVYDSGYGAKSRLIIGNQIFSALFAMAPSSKALFDRVGVEDMSSGAFHAHTVRVMNGLDMGINALNDTATLASLTSHLAAQHAVRPGVKAIYFDVMGKVLMTALPALINDFNPDAWGNCLIPLKDAISVDLS